jgi:hypothetical protein
MENEDPARASAFYAQQLKTVKKALKGAGVSSGSVDGLARHALGVSAEHGPVNAVAYAVKVGINLWKREQGRAARNTSVTNDIQDTPGSFGIDEDALINPSNASDEDLERAAQREMLHALTDSNDARRELALDERFAMAAEMLGAGALDQDGCYVPSLGDRARARRATVDSGNRALELVRSIEKGLKRRKSENRRLSPRLSRLVNELECQLRTVPGVVIPGLMAAMIHPVGAVVLQDHAPGARRPTSRGIGALLVELNGVAVALEAHLRLNGSPPRGGGPRGDPADRWLRHALRRMFGFTDGQIEALRRDRPQVAALLKARPGSGARKARKRTALR